MWYNNNEHTYNTRLQTLMASSKWAVERCYPHSKPPLSI